MYARSRLLFVLFIMSCCIALTLSVSGWAADTAITRAEWDVLMQDARFKAADQKLGATFKATLTALPEASRQRLRAEQRAWVAKREAEAFAKFAKGTPEYAHFLIEEAHARVAELQALAAASSYFASGDMDATRPQASAGNVQTGRQFPDFATVRSAAEQDDAEEQNRLGMMYFSGVGVPKDESKALEWWTRAAAQGHPKAQYNLGMMYSSGGDGVPKDAAKAAQWYQKAAEQGDADAQRKLDAMQTARKEGTPRDSNNEKPPAAAQSGQSSAQAGASKSQDAPPLTIPNTKYACNDVYRVYRYISGAEGYRITQNEKILDSKYFIELTQNDLDMLYAFIVKCSKTLPGAFDPEYTKSDFIKRVGNNKLIIAEDIAVEQTRKKKQEEDDARYAAEQKRRQEEYIAEQEQQRLQQQQQAEKLEMIAAENRKKIEEERAALLETRKRQKEEQEQKQKDDERFIAENTNTALAMLKDAHFSSYPKKQGYETIGKAFNRFFERPNWEIQPTAFGWMVTFNGNAKLVNGQKARFTWVFPVNILDVRAGGFEKFDYNPLIASFHFGVFVNDTASSLKDINNFLAAIFLN